jgi:hypothetical protein
METKGELRRKGGRDKEMKIEVRINKVIELLCYFVRH